MKILVTGAAGFIGFHVSNALVREGHEVVGLDNFNDYYDPALKRARAARLAALPRYRGVEGDIVDGGRLAQLFAEHRFDRVCHLAAQAGVRYSVTHPHVYQKSNLEGFLHILEACRNARTPRLVYASSSSVYGGNTTLPFRETDRVDTPVSLYAATKRANELMAHVYVHLYGLPCVGLRFFTVYGPWGRPDMAMWQFTDAMLAGKPIKVYNHGRMRRDFTYVDDIVAGVLASLFREGLEPFEVINLGNHRPEPLLDFIALLGRTLGVEPKMEMLPLQPGDVPETFADIERARAKLGFEPVTPIGTGVPRFVDWYLDYHRLAKPRPR